MSISDAIAAYIMKAMEQSEGGYAELQRNELAEHIGCVPSQISYVLSSRFTPEQGYVVESRRGGSGYIRIRRVQYRPEVSALMHTVNAIGPTVSQAAAQVILQNLVYGGHLPAASARIIMAGVSDMALRRVETAGRDELRAVLLKQMLAAAAAR